MTGDLLQQGIILSELGNSEQEHYNTNYWDAQDILTDIAAGKTENLEYQLDDAFITHFISHGGIVSNNPQKRIEYLMVIAIHRMGKAAIDGGVFPTEASRIADYYLRRLSESANPYKEIKLVRRAAFACASAVAKRKENILTNGYIEEIKDYVLTHLTQKIRLSNLAASLGISPCHLSRMFHKVTGQTLSSYILHQKVEASSILLLHTDKPISEICAFFQFSNQSYYTKKFAEVFGITPKQYYLNNRKMNASEASLSDVQQI